MIKILIIDESESDLKLAKWHLERLSAELEIVLSQSAMEALETLGRERFDCVLCDYLMPEVDGLDFLRLIRERGDDIPVIFLTGQGSEDVAAEALRAGADDYLTKAATSSQFVRLLSSIKRLVDAYRQRVRSREATEALRRSEERYRVLFNMINDAVFVHEFDSLAGSGRIVEVNDVACRLLGFERADLMRMTVRDIVAQEHLQRAEGYSQKVKGGRPAVFEINVRDGNGAGIPCEISSQVFELEGKPLIISLARDIRERTIAQAALRESEERYRNLFDSMSSGVAIYEVDEDKSKIIFKDVNPAVEQMDKIGREEIIGRDVREVFPGIEEFGLFDVLKRVHRTGKPVRYPTKLYKDGRIEGWRENFVYRLPTGEVVAVYDDVTERQRALESLEESEERFRLLAENVDDIFWISKITDGDIMPYTSPAFEKVVGLSSERLREGSSFWQLFIHPDDRQGVLEDMIRTIETGEKIDHEFRIVRPDGSARWIWNRAFPVRDAGGKLSKLVGIAKDITERKEAEERELLQREQLIQADKMVSLGILVSGVAHEINNPNHFIATNAPILQRAWEDVLPVLDRHAKEEGDFDIAGMPYSRIRAGIPALISGILEGSERIKYIVQELRDFARRSHADEMSSVNVNAVVQSAVVLVSNLLRKSTSRFSVHFEEDLAPVKGNFRRLEQVVINLITNACQALSDKNQAVTVSTGQDAREGTVLIKVVDEGSGIEKDMLRHITDPFFTTKREQGGTGLGLSISSTIISEHCGAIEFNSRPGRGTEAVVTLPMREEARRVSQERK